MFAATPRFAPNGPIEGLQWSFTSKDCGPFPGSDDPGPIRSVDGGSIRYSPFRRLLEEFFR